jgi:hypothetical protein
MLVISTTSNMHGTNVKLKVDILNILESLYAVFVIGVCSAVFVIGVCYAVFATVFVLVY